MNSIVLSLAWKEFRDLRWKLVAMIVIVVVCALAMELYDRGSVFPAGSAILVAYVAIGALFFGENLAAGEKSQGTVPFLLALPVARWKVAAVKFMVTALVSIVPIVVTVLLIGAYHRICVMSDVDLSNQLTLLKWQASGLDWYEAHLVLPLFAMMSLLVWVAALGVRQKDEIRVGAIGILAVFCIWLSLGVLIGLQVQEPAYSLPEPLEMAIASAPGGLAATAVSANRLSDGERGYLSLLSGEWLRGPVLFSLLVHACLVGRFLFSFGQTTTKRESRYMVNSDYTKYRLRSPWKSPLAAIVWKQARETTPIAVVGAVAILFASFATAASAMGRTNFLITLVDVSLSWWMTLGFIASVIAGVGVMGQDLNTSLHTFWRSRPIDVDQWFWVKVTTGLILLVSVLAIPNVVVYATCSWLGEAGDSWRSYYSAKERPFLMGSGFHLLAYCGALAAMCLVRKPLYAAIFAFASWAFSSAVSEVIGYEATTFAKAANLAFVLSGITMLVGWWAVRNDIAWRP